MNTALLNTPITALMIVNPNSRSGADTDISEGLRLLAEHGINVIQKTSSSAKQTAQHIHEFAAQVQLVILGGGDGTISSAAGTLYKHQLPFAILPLGTANDLAHSLDIPPNVPEAFEIIAKNHRGRINLGMINEHYFLNAAHIGLGVKVTSELTPEVKKKWGVFSYLKAAFSAFKKNRPFRVTIKANGKEHKLRSIQVAIGNGRFYGGGNVIDEKSKIDDGALCLYSLAPSSMWELLKNAVFLRYGKHSYIPTCFTGSAKRIEIKTRRPKEIIADGEPISTTPALFEVIPNALEVIRPAPNTI